MLGTRTRKREQTDDIIPDLKIFNPMKEIMHRLKKKAVISFVILILKMLWRQRVINFYWDNLRDLPSKVISHLGFEGWIFYKWRI